MHGARGESLEANSPPGRTRKLGWKALANDVKENPDKRLVDRAKELNVWTNSIWYALTEMDIKYKKTLRYAERDPESRMRYLSQLRQIIKERGKQNLVYIDESGFEEYAYRTSGWLKRGVKGYGERPGITDVEPIL